MNFNQHFSIYTTNGDVLKKLTSSSGDTSTLRGQAYCKYLFGVDDLDMQRSNIISGNINSKRSWFDNCDLTRSNIMNPTGSRFAYATLIGTTISGECRDLCLEGANLIGANIVNAKGMLDGGYTPEGNRIVFNLRANTWWVSFTHNPADDVSRDYYIAVDELPSTLANMGDMAFAAFMSSAVNKVLPRIRAFNINSEPVVTAPPLKSSKDVLSSLVALTQQYKPSDREAVEPVDNIR